VLHAQFEKLARLIVEKRRRALLLITACIALSVPFAVNTLRHLDANLLNQVSDKLPRFKALKEVTTDFGGDILVAVVSIPTAKATTPDCAAELKSFADSLTTEMESVGSHPEDQAELAKTNAPPLEGPWLRQVRCKTGNDLRADIAEALRDYPQLALSIEDVDELTRRFEPAALSERLHALREELAELPANSAERLKLLRDPLDLTGLAQSRMNSSFNKSQMTLGSDEYLLSKDGTTLLVLSRPTRSSNNVVFNRVLMQACQRAENRAIAKHREKFKPSQFTFALRANAFGAFQEGQPAAPELSVGYTGLHALSVENERSLRKDIMEGSAEAFAALVIIFLVAYRSLRLTLDVTLTLIFAALLTVGIYGCVHGKIGVLGAGFTSILIGTGVDYGIMIYGTFRRFRMQGQSAEDAIKATLVQRGPGLMLACFTSVVGFFGLVIVDFQAIAEFGLLTGIGLAASAILMALLFPILLLRHNNMTFAQPTPLGLRTLGNFLSTKGGRALALGLSAVIIFACGWLLAFQPPLEEGMEKFLGVRFDPDIGNMRNRTSPASLLRDRIVEKFGRGFADIRVIVEAENETRALAASEDVKKRLSSFLSSGTLQPGGSLVDFVPGFQHQAGVLEKLNRTGLQEKSAQFMKAAESEFGAGAKSSFAPFIKSMDDFSTKLANAKILTLDELLRNRFGSLLVPYARIDSDAGKPRVRLVSYFFPKDLQYTEEWLRGLADNVEKDPPSGSLIRLTAARFVGFELKRSVISDMQWIFAVVALLVAIIVWLPLKSARQALLSTIPLGFSFLFVLAGIAFSERTGGDLSLNYISLMIFPILMGSAVDYGIYMVLDMNAGRFNSISDLLEETGHSLVLCCGTTLGGYGSMVLGSNSGMISFGWTALLGYLGALFAAIVVIPAISPMQKETPSN
jgi:predicted RND superfamily exporter protein